MNYQNFLKKLLRSCDDMALSEAEYALELQPCPLNEQGYAQTRNVNLLSRWIDGKNIPASIRAGMIEHFESEGCPKVWSPVIEALRKNDRNFLETK